MNESPDRFPWETDDDAFMGPAVPEDDRGQEEDALAEPLAPFVGGEQAEGSDEMPWLIPDDADLVGVDALSTPAGAPTDRPAAPSEDSEPAFAPPLSGLEPAAEAAPAPAPAESQEPDGWSPFDDLPGTEALTSEPEPVQPTRQDAGPIGVGAPPEHEPDEAEPSPAPAFGAWPENTVPQTVGPVPGTEPLEAPAAAPGLSDAAEAVAGRLESIARTLRNGDVSALLGPSADPLESFVVGYVLGSTRPDRG